MSPCIFFEPDIGLFCRRNSACLSRATRRLICISSREEKPLPAPRPRFLNREFELSSEPIRGGHPKEFRELLTQENPSSGRCPITPALSYLTGSDNVAKSLMILSRTRLCGPT